VPIIPPSEFRVVSARSGGPGGQNVNKVESKVQLRWPVGASAVFSDAQKDRIRTALQNRINTEDELMIDVDEERSQAQNRDIAIVRLHALVAEAVKPKKTRKRTRPTKASKERRLFEKKKMAEKKRLRGRMTSDM
jgi:ribosome-associated protein